MSECTFMHICSEVVVDAGRLSRGPRILGPALKKTKTIEQLVKAAVPTASR
jgi:hypothetical protein